MAAASIVYAVDALALLPDERRESLCEHLGIDRDEIQHWDDVSRRLRIPIRANGIIDQFEGYAELEELDWDAAQKKYGNIQRLDRLLEADGDTPNRYKASKQADVLMLFYLFSADELAQLFERLGYSFERDTIPRNIDYYIVCSSHVSLPIWLVHSCVLSRAIRSGPWEMFCAAAHVDLMPTVLDALEVPMPSAVQIDGRSFWPQITGKRAGAPDRPIVIQTHRGDLPQRYHHMMVRTGDWKLVHPSGFGQNDFEGAPDFELYDLEADPSEADGSGDDDGEATYDYGDSQERLSLEPGARVVHPRFGSGTVSSVSGSGRSTKAEIEFDDAGTKKVMVAHADLRPA
jgi:hypothetical protein